MSIILIDIIKLFCYTCFMNVVEAGCFIERKSDLEFELKPVTNLDKNLLLEFIENKGRYVNVRIMKRIQAKTYEQTKAFWALLSVYYKSLIGRTPTSKELDWFYEELRSDLLPVRASILYEGKIAPKRWSEITKEEGIEVINKLIVLVSEQNSVPVAAQTTVRDVFEWLQQEKNSLPQDPCDFHEDGTPLTKEEWSEKNKICMVTGIMGGDVCHIVSRELGKGYSWLIEQPWNFYRASHEIHINIQHQMGWEFLFNGVKGYTLSNGKLFMGAPWLRPRYERAMRLFNEGKRLANENVPYDEIICRLSGCTERKVQTTSNTKSLAEQAAEEKDVPEDIF